MGARQQIENADAQTLGNRKKLMHADDLPARFNSTNRITAQPNHLSQRLLRYA